MCKKSVKLNITGCGLFRVKSKDILDSCAGQAQLAALKRIKTKLKRV